MRYIPKRITVLKKKLGPIILVALIAHHTLILKSYNDTSRNNMGFSGDPTSFIMRNPLFADIKPSLIATRMSVGSEHFTSNHRLMVPGHKIQSSLTICVEETVNNICVTRRYTQNWMATMNAYTNLRAVILSLFCPLRNKTYLHSLIPTPGGNKCFRKTCRYEADYISGTQFVFESDAPGRWRYINWLNFTGVLGLDVGPIIWAQVKYLVQVGLGGT